MQKKNPHVVFTQWREKVIELHFWFTTNKKLHLWQIQIPRGNKSLFFFFLRLVSMLAVGLHCKRFQDLEIEISSQLWMQDVLIT